MSFVCSIGEGVDGMGIAEGEGSPAREKDVMGSVDDVVDSSYLLQRQELAEGVPLIIRYGDRALILVSGPYTPESGDVPMVEALEVQVLSERSGVHPDRAVDIFKEALRREASQEPTGV